MPSPKPITLALQGGGAHGAYTWGVLDRLLEGDEVEITALSGTSAGALNGAAVKAGMVSGGAAGARDLMREVWHRISGLPDLDIAHGVSPFLPGNAFISKAIEYSPAFQVGENLSRASSPYLFGGFYQNPLKSLIKDLPFDLVCSPKGPELFICATNVRTGKVKVFADAEISPDAVLASACLPTLFQAVEIDGEAYWDGGYTGNPALFPLYEDRFPDDLVIVNINPLQRETLPYSSQDILNRINEISFNSSLLRDLRAIRFVQRLIEQGKIDRGAMKYVLVHMIDDTEMMNDLSVATKLVPQPVVMKRLFESGRAAAERWLDSHLDSVGSECSVDLAAMYD